MQRPTSVTVFGVLNIVFGILGVCGLAFASMLIWGPAAGRQNVAMPLDNPLYLGWMAVSSVLGAVAAIVQVAAGFGLLNLRPWVRVASIGFAIYSVLGTILGTAVQFIVVTLPVLESAPANGSPEAIGMVAGSIGGCAGLIYPVLLFHFMTRPHVKAAFAGTWAPAEFAVVPAQDHLIQSPPAAASDNPFAAPAATKELPVGATIVGRPHSPASESIVEAFIPSKNGPALVSYYLGLFSLFPLLGFFLGVAAVYYGVRGLRNVRENPTVRGGAHAWVGLICGSIFGLFNMVLLGFAVFGAILAATGQLK